MEKTQKNPLKYCCKECDFISSNIKDYNRHISTRKHINRTNLNNFYPKKPQEYICKKCNKIYKARNSLWYHEKTCIHYSINHDVDNDNDTIDITDNTDIYNKEMIVKLLNQNNELQKQVIELMKNGTNHINSHNKTFNLQFFLNETCKDAMNIMDFVNNMQLQLEDLENMSEIGYVNGISNIIIKSLKNMDITERPIHCTDKKREIIYVKDENKWDKESQGNPKLRKAIKHVAHKNSYLLNDFREKHPDCIKANSKHADKYTKLIIESMGGLGEDEIEKENKIIHNLAKEVTLDNKKSHLL